MVLERTTLTSTITVLSLDYSVLGICFMLCTHFFLSKEDHEVTPFLPFLSVALPRCPTY